MIPSLPGFRFTDRSHRLMEDKLKATRSIAWDYTLRKPTYASSTSKDAPALVGHGYLSIVLQRTDLVQHSKRMQIKPTGHRSNAFVFTWEKKQLKKSLTDQREPSSATFGVPLSVLYPIFLSPLPIFAPWTMNEISKIRYQLHLGVGLGNPRCSVSTLIKSGIIFLGCNRMNVSFFNVLIAIRVLDPLIR